MIRGKFFLVDLLQSVLSLIVLLGQEAAHRIRPPVHLPRWVEVVLSLHLFRLVGLDQFIEVHDPSRRLLILVAFNLVIH